MKKQWILIIVLAAVLVTAVIIASRSFPDVSQNPGSNDTNNSETTGTESNSSEPFGENNEVTFSTVSYEEYQNMSDSDRNTYFDQFPSFEAYEAWLTEAKAQYEADRATIPTIEGNGSVNIGDFINGTEE